MNQKLKFLCFRGIHNSLPSFWAKLGYSRIKIDYIADSLLKLQIKIGVHLINAELSQLLTLVKLRFECPTSSSNSKWGSNIHLPPFKIRKACQLAERKMTENFCHVELSTSLCEISYSVLPSDGDKWWLCSTTYLVCITTKVGYPRPLYFEVWISGCYISWAPYKLYNIDMKKSHFGTVVIR